MHSQYVRKIFVYKKIQQTSTEFIFRSLSICKRSTVFKLKGVNPLSYTRAREILLSALESIGLDKSKFVFHSLRSGGATAAASAGIHDRLFKNMDVGLQRTPKTDMSEKMYLKN